MSNTELDKVTIKHPAMLASVGDIRSYPKLRFSEQIYTDTMSDLAGVSFEPLAGIVVTFLPVEYYSLDAPKLEDNHVGNLIFQGLFIEYLTGRRAVIRAVVSFNGSYRPLNVEEEAFESALTHSLEFYLNRCGYTAVNEAPDGLRKLSDVCKRHLGLNMIMSPLTVFNGTRFGEGRPGKESAGKVVSRVSENGDIELVRKVDKFITKYELRLVYSGFHYIESELQQIRLRSHVDVPDDVIGCYVWFFIEEKKGRDSLLAVTREPFFTIPSDDLEKTVAAVGCFKVSDLVGISAPMLSGGFGIVENDELVVTIPTDLSILPSPSKVAFTSPEQWIAFTGGRIKGSMAQKGGVVNLHFQPARYDSEDDFESRLFSLNPHRVVNDTSNSFISNSKVELVFVTHRERLLEHIGEMKEWHQQLIKEREAAALRKQLDELEGKAPPPIPADATVVEVTASIKNQKMPLTFFDRIGMAWRAFTTSDPFYED